MDIGKEKKIALLKKMVLIRVFEEKAEEEKEEPKPTREEIEKQREDIQKENDRKKEEYEQKIKDGEDKVKELNARFADWYYVVSEDVYQKIHLNRGDVVVEKEATETEGTGIDSFRALETEGLKREDPETTPEADSSLEP